MANRTVRRTAVLAKIETVYGTDSVPTGAANAMLVSNLSYPAFNAQNVDRDLIRPFLGASEQLVGTANYQCGFDIEIAGSGTAGTAPPWAALLRACGFAETITAGNRVEYLPISDAMESATIYWYDSGVWHKLIGARGTVVFKLGVGERPVMSFSFTGLYAAPTAAEPSGVTLTAFKTPQVITDANTGDITLGATYATGALTGGTAYPSRGIQVDIGNVVNHMPLLGSETVEVTDRDVTGSFQLDLTAAQEVAFMANVTANVLQSVGFLHGTVAGNIFGLFLAAAQLTNPSKQELNGKRLIGYDARFVPVAGNDEIRIFLK